MRKSVILFACLCGAICGAIIYLKSQKTEPVSKPATAAIPSDGPKITQAREIPVVAPEQSPLATTNAGTQMKSPATTPVASETNSNTPANPVSQSVDLLLSAKSGAQKHELFQKLVQAGELDQVIAELKQRATANPNDAEIPTTLGEALLNKVRATLAANGGQNGDDIALMAVQADQEFNAALKIDPKNWEAQFVKAASLERWPANPERDGQVVQQLSNLIDQQDSMPSQPEFAQTYLVLGNEFQKIGQPDKAQATWLLGAQKFPNNAALQQKLNGQ